MEPANVEQAAAWNAGDGDHWARFAVQYDELTERFSDELLAGAELSPSDAVLDVGCGCGATTIAAAGQARTGRAVGADLSRPMLEVARRRSVEAGVGNVAFRQGDAQVATFGEDFDVVISRFGVMFFDDPVAAFANLARQVRPGGRLAVVVWREPFENEWVVVPGAALAEHVDFPDLAHGSGPGPFSLADRDRVLAVLGSAGWEGVELAPVDVPMRFPGPPVDEAVDFLRDFPIVRAVLAPVSGPEREAAMRGVREALLRHTGENGSTQLQGSGWLVRARLPE